MPPSRATEHDRLLFRALECMRGDCDAKWWGWAPERPPASSPSCDRHIWLEPHTFVAYGQGPGLSPVPIGGIGG